MSFIIKRIPMELTEESIDNAIRIIQTVKDLLHPAMIDYIGKLAAKGVEIARAELIFFPDPAYYYGDLSESVKYDYTDDGAIISAGEGLESGYPGQSYAMFVEYGTGVFGADVNDHGWEGWTYFNPRDGRFHFTVGMPARPFMHNTYEDLIAEVHANGGIIVAEYIRDHLGGE